MLVGIGVFILSWVFNSVIFYLLMILDRKIKFDMTPLFDNCVDLIVL